MKFTGILAAPQLSATEMKEAMGSYRTLEHVKKIEKSTAVIDETDGRFVARFQNFCIPLELQKAAEASLLRAAKSGDFSNRAAFLGKGLQNNLIKGDGSLSERRGVPKSIVKLGVC